MGRLLFALVLAFFGWIAWQATGTTRRAMAREAERAELARTVRDDSLAEDEAMRALRRASAGGRARSYAGNAGTPEWIHRLQARRLRTPNAAPVRDWAADEERVQRYGAYTYLEDIAAQNDGRIARWPARTEPLRVWVQGQPGIPGWTGEHRSVARGALRTWDAAQLPFRIVVADDSSQADVFVLWSRSFGGFGGRIGETNYMTDEHGWIVAATITIALESGGKPLDVYTVQNVARHEIGHAIGLDHSPVEDDIMAAYAGRHDRLSERDVNTARLLYALSPGRYPGKLPPREPGHPYARPRARN